MGTLTRYFMVGKTNNSLQVTVQETAFQMEEYSISDYLDITYGVPYKSLFPCINQTN